MKVIFLVFLLISFQVEADQNFDQQKSVLSQMADQSCLGLIPIGICPKLKHLVGALVLLREPSLIIRTVDRNDASSIRGSNLHFNEVAILNNPLARSFHQAVCSDIPDPFPGVYYMSQADSLEWKRATVEKKLPQSILASEIAPQCYRLPLGEKGQCMKNWGVLYPRTGFVVTPSAPVASAVSAVRAVSIAKDRSPGHIITAPLNYAFNLKEDKLQMIQPVMSASCISIGENPASWEQNKTSKDGQYVWFYWNWRLCCI